jgi:hypothetical protein
VHQEGAAADPALYEPSRFVEVKAQTWQSGYQRDGDERREGHRAQPRAGHAAVLD